jgi:hypothetical protein
MRNTVLLVVLVSALCWAAPNPGEYAINIHVSGSRLFSEAAASGLRQQLIVVINGKKYELLSISGEGKLLALGDYMAKLTRDDHKSAYESSQIRVPVLDKKTRQYMVVGQSE